MTEAVSAIVSKYGVAALELDHNPTLRDRLLRLAGGRAQSSAS
jgi:hypothetical protein